MKSSDPNTKDISHCRIHPAVGIARVGNSPNEYFIGSEVPGVFSKPHDGLFKDKQGRIKRQAVRFRIYAYDSSDKVVKELNSDDCLITWNVHLVNRKSASNLFEGYYDPSSSKKRNADILEENKREKILVNDPGPISITGVNQSGDSFKFDKGECFGIKVPLGEIQTDEKGRLIVLGGFGRSDCKNGQRDKYPLTNFANNDGWFDDTSDGPVTAIVSLDGNTIPVKDSSWVVVSPPKFAPYHQPIVTLYDTMKQIAIDEKWISPQKQVSFTEDIFPILHRVTQYRWLNSRAFRGHGKNQRGDFLAEIPLLANNKSPDGSVKRKRIFERIRNPYLVSPDTPEEEKKAREQASQVYMPPMSGDDGDMTPGNYKSWMKLHHFQYENLRKWSQGDFISDWEEGMSLWRRDDKVLEELSIEEQPFALDRASTDLSIGAPLYPGIEVTHYLYKKEYYAGKAFRIDPNLEPGSLTKQMAIPWQADFYYCADTWWPTARPDSIFVDEDKVEPWARGIENVGNDIVDMIDKWSKLGFVKYVEKDNNIFFLEGERNL